MIKLKDFLKVADDQVVIINGCDDVVLINDSFLMQTCFLKNY